MKKANLLSKAEMKKVMGGLLPQAGCTSDSQCGAGESCCPDYANWGTGPMPFACSGPSVVELPDGTSTTMACS
jgi:hypothetical protein